MIGAIVKEEIEDPMVQMNIRIPKSLKQEITAMAKKEGVPVTLVLARALRWKLAQMKGRKVSK